MATDSRAYLAFACLALTASCSSASRAKDECEVGNVCTLVAIHETYLDLRVVNMTKDPITLPLLHGIGKAESPGVFVMDYVKDDVKAAVGANPPSLEGQESVVLFPREGISFALSWDQYRMIFDHDSGCKDVVANFVINEWAKQGVYYESAITTSKARICLPSP